MLVTFSSKAYENLSYFQGVAEQLIRLMGHSGTIPGAIKAADVPDALHHLQEGLAGGTANEPTHFEEDTEIISLTKRAIPLTHLLEASIKQHCDVLWAFSD